MRVVFLIENLMLKDVCLLSGYSVVIVGRQKNLLIAVEDRSAATLLPIINNYVRQGSKIYSNEWKAYQQLTDLGFEHDTVCHKYNFIDPETGAHTQGIGSTWRVPR